MNESLEINPINQKYSAKIDVFILLGITVVWLGIALLIKPWGDFPLNDDWVYAKGTRAIVEKGYFDLSGGHSTPNVIAQAYWGALFCLPFGFSFTALRLSILTLGLAGVTGTYCFLKEISANWQFSLLGTALVALNPIYIGLSSTFMTDIPFYAAAIFSFYFVIRGLRKDKNSEIILGIFLSYVALLVRQLGLAVPLAFAFAYLVKKGISFKNVLVAVLPTAIGVAIQLSYQTWLEVTGRNSAILGMQAEKTLTLLLFANLKIAINFINNTLIGLIYLGLFLSPLLLILFAHQLKIVSKRHRNIALFSLAILFVLIVGQVMIERGDVMPLAGNILTSFGLGPLTLRDTFVLETNFPQIPTALRILWLVLTVIAIACSTILVYYAFWAWYELFKHRQGFKFNRQQWLNVFILFAIGIYYLPLGIQGFFDRYFLLLLPLISAVLFLIHHDIQDLKLTSKSIAVNVVILALCFYFSANATHDYIEWNRVRWEAINNLMDNPQITPNQIDGGYEFNGWYLFSADYQETSQKSWWWVDEDNYTITFGELEGYDIMDTYPLSRRLPFGPEQILVLEKS